MQSLLFYAPGDARLVDVPIPAPGPGELLVRVGAALTCGTDLKAYQRGHPRLFRTLPSPFGHEFAGTIAALGAGVERFAVGQRVVAANSAPCGACDECRRHRESLCERLEFLNGAYAEYIIVPERIARRNTYLLPDELPFAEAALAEPLACVLHGMDALDIHLGDTVVVNGAGPIGLLFVNALTRAGAQVIACDRNDVRLAAARHFGAFATVDVRQTDDQVGAVRALTPNARGVDVAIEAVGLPDVWEKTTRMARTGGVVLLFGGARSGTALAVDTVLLHYSELTLKGVFHHTPEHFARALDLISTGAICARDYLTANRPLAQTIAALEEHGPRRGVKTVILPPGCAPARLGVFATDPTEETPR